MLAFNRLRLKVEQHAEALKQGEEAATVEQLEDMMTRCHHMLTVYYEYQVLLESAEFSLSAPIQGDAHIETYRQGARTIRTLREGTDYVQRRLEALLNQHMIDRQTRMDGRVRVLTIVSAVILPLTLIAGIYGMNFPNMPELQYGFAYFAVLTIMVVLAGGMIGFFYWKGWFR